MKFLIFVLTAMLLLAGCVRKKPETKADPHEGIDMSGMASGGLDLDAMLASLPEGWTRREATSSMRLAEIALRPAKGDTASAELAFFHFPGTGGSSAANIARWQGQFQGPKGEPGAQAAKTDTMMAGYLTVVTTDVTGTQIGSASMMGGADTNIPNMRMIASVIETPSGNWFVKVVGPKNTVAAHESKIRSFLKSAKVKGPQPK